MRDCYQTGNSSSSDLLPDWQTTEVADVTNVATMATQKLPRLFITEWMDHFHLSDEKLADKLSCARETIWRWRNEQHRLNPDKIASLAAAMSIRPEDLWRPPTQPSVDALLRGASLETLQQARDVIEAMVKNRRDSSKSG
jgi:transcriptional regulator with XRE-family HTH domain